MTKKFAFTLAEVLITLAIIGVVAVLTVPTLVNNYQKKLTLVRLQKAYNTLSNVFKLSSIENGSPNTWNWDNPQDILKNNLGKYLRVSKYYDSSDDKTPLCHEKQITSYQGYTYAWLDNSIITTPFMDSNYSLLTQDGICIGLNKYLQSDTSTRTYRVYVDINSSINGPNIAGKDLFFFYIDEQTGAFSALGDIETYESATSKNACHRDASHGGLFCAFKIMRDGWQIKDDYPW